MLDVPFKTLVHGDSKIDNFMFKKNYDVYDAANDTYNAVIVDWQVG